MGGGALAVVERATNARSRGFVGIDESNPTLRAHLAGLRASRHQPRLAGVRLRYAKAPAVWPSAWAKFVRWGRRQQV